MALTGAIIVQAPEGAVIDAIWRCKRGHEAPAAWHTSTEIVPNAFDLAFSPSPNEAIPICVRCLIDDYGVERINFKEERDG